MEIVSSEEILRHASRFAQSCDVIIDHTDTFMGGGFFRPLVRRLLEDRGARVVGADARSCFLADDKAAARQRMAAAGIPVTPGVLVEEGDYLLPAWLKPPLIIKPAFEHMSRGIRVAVTCHEARREAEQLMAAFRQPVIVESFIEGQDLAVSLLEGPGGIEVLPPLIWSSDGGKGWLTFSYKNRSLYGHHGDILRADLSPAEAARLEELARRAFLTLGLRDYGRFDIRRSADGAFYFLEANTTPSLETPEVLAISARWAGMAYGDLVAHLLTAAERRDRIVKVPTVGGVVSVKCPPGVAPPAVSTLELAGLLDVRTGEKVLDLGSGTGILALTALSMGAALAVATDQDARALEIAEYNGAINGVSGRLLLCRGHWFDPLSSLPDGVKGRPFDIIMATPPQTPGPENFGPRYGGADGTDHLLHIAEEAPRHLMPDTGRLWLLLMTIADVERVLAELGRRFHSVEIVGESRRVFTFQEYGLLHPRLPRHILGLRAAGKAEFQELGGGRYAFRNLFVRAWGPRRQKVGWRSGC